MARELPSWTAIEHLVDRISAQRIRARRLLIFVGSSDDPLGATGISVHIVEMKRAHDIDESATKRLRLLAGDGVNDTQGKEIVRQVADHYSARSNQTREQREASPIIHLKKLNNWIKSVLIQIYTQRGDTVLDMACGKGGDLIKWDKASIGYYVGIDIAEGSIEDARKRYNGETDHARGRRDFGFPAKLICADCFEFAMHYSWDTEERARRAFRNVSAILQPGGCFIGTMPDADVLVRKLRDAPELEFGNRVYRVRFDEKYSEKQFPSSTPYGIQYEFHLEDAVDCPEWLVPFQCFKSLAAEYGLELVFKSNFHSFVKQYCQQKDFADLMRKLGALGDSAAGDAITDDEWDAAYIYLVFVFRKSGNKPPRPRSSRGTYKIISPDEVIYIPQ
ncbi:mRNA cap guanine-N(7) methyltransferase 1 isoform X3 [Physcomitrium patens]|uniref:mRNA cap guanine-N(7) methyltransferase 1 isoform X3 n=1 Tax=Physcomitrium patens TaxID=3218 RepID=UPI000D1775C8|nr:mRNA cap guanine-N7 methyltransferase 1-like isoform X3 [Physcomitrium patens]|eukprot:XP_024361760.1 mRNA cap guanine-N7 methyltransferase 1-like isoform X3 [Physcomitrella patens]